MCKETSNPGPAEEKPQPRFVPTQNRRSFTQSRFYHRFRYILRVPFSSSAARFVTSTLILCSAAHAFAYFWKGPDHPLNRYRLIFQCLLSNIWKEFFRWRQMKKRGELSPEMLEKERLLNKYYYDNFTNPREPMSLPRTGFA